MKHLKRFEEKTKNFLPLENSKFKIGDEVIYLGSITEGTLLTEGEKVTIVSVHSTNSNYFYKVATLTGDKVIYFIPEDRFNTELEYQVNKFNL